MKTIGGNIYYPDILDGSTILGETTNSYSLYKDVVNVDDENISFKTKMFIGINKVIELANVFDCVYLDKLEYSFIIKDMFRNYPNICLELLNEGKISFIDNDKYFMLYDLRDEKSYIQVHCTPKISNGKIIEDINVEGNVGLTEAINKSIKKSIYHNKINAEYITRKFDDSLKRGYFQALAIGINSIVSINKENKELYDLVSQLALNKYICDLCGIENIYLKDYFYWADKYECKFKNAIYSERTIFDTEYIDNTTFALASNQKSGLTNNELLLKASDNKKEMSYSKYPNEYTHLKKTFSTDVKSDYLYSEIYFIKQNNEKIVLSISSFEEYFKEMQNRGIALRQTKLFIKITSREYVESFLDGNIRFAKPIEFISDNKGAGQNDNTEGSFKSECIDGKRICTRNVYDLNFTRIWCCFGLDNYMFVDSLVDGRIEKKAIVKKEYYNGFLDERNNKKNVVIMIRPDAFVDRVVKSLISKGIFSNDIIIQPITYINKRENFNLSCEPPFELFYKDISYLCQNEIRILIRNSANKYDYLFSDHGVINVGSIRDICTVIDGMYNEDMECFLLGDNQMLFSLPSKSNIRKDD